MKKANFQNYIPQLRNIVAALKIPRYNATKSNSHKLCFGRKGSLHICTHGQNAGLYYDFEEGKGGNIIGLIQRQLKCSWHEACRFAEACDVDSSTAYFEDPISDIYHSTCMGSSDLSFKHYLLHSEPLMESSWNHGRNYLKSTRGIQDLCKIKHKDIRMIPPHMMAGQDMPALMCCARNTKNEQDDYITGVQVIFLNEYEDGVKKAINQTVQKKSMGRIGGSFVCLQKPLNAKHVCLAEGLETGLSVATSFPNECSVYISLGLYNFRNFRDFISVAEESASHVILCEDNDDSECSSNVINDAKNSLEKTYNVYRIKPDKGDFNDVIKDHGVSGVQKYFESANCFI